MIKNYNINIDNYLIPILIIELKEVSIISIPTQIGCPIKCKFCISSKTKFKRNLKYEEMIYLINESLKKIKNINNVILSLTGEGEFLLNIDNVNKVIEYTNKDNRINSLRLATSGIKIENLRKINKSEKEMELQFSLHSSFDSNRKNIIPITSNIDNIIKNIKENEYKFKKISLNYVLMKDINDTKEDLINFKKIINKKWEIKLNPLLDEKQFNLSLNSDLFYENLKKSGYNVKIYNKIGEEIKNNIYNDLTYKII